jgi:S-adenosylmethionine/arginine decarboxylase-like enzyme
MAPKKANKTRKVNRPSQKVQHHHLLMRLELETCPKKEDKEKIEHMIGQIIKDVQMKSLAAPSVYYMTYPRFNEGLTGIAPIETSHIAFHFWNRPDPRILHTGKSNCLLQMDVYTCGSLTIRNIGLILHHLTQYKPSYIDITLLNRNTGLTIDRHMHWSMEENPLSWAEWLDTPVFH